MQVTYERKRGVRLKVEGVEFPWRNRQNGDGMISSENGSHATQKRRGRDIL